MNSKDQPQRMPVDLGARPKTPSMPVDLGARPKTLSMPIDLGARPKMESMPVDLGARPKMESMPVDLGARPKTASKEGLLGGENIQLGSLSRPTVEIRVGPPIVEPVASESDRSEQALELVALLLPDGERWLEEWKAELSYLPPGERPELARELLAGAASMAMTLYRGKFRPAR